MTNPFIAGQWIADVKMRLVRVSEHVTNPFIAGQWIAAVVTQPDAAIVVSDQPLHRGAVDRCHPHAERPPRDDRE